MNKMKLMGIMILGVCSFGVTLSQEAVASDISICSNGICLQRQRDGSGVELRPDFRNSPGRRPPPPGRRPPPHRWPDPVRGYEYFTCESRDHRTNECYFDSRRVYRVRMVRQISNASCVEGRTYGTDYRNGLVWVTNGCRAEFRVER